MTLRIVVIGTGFGERLIAPIYQALGHEVTVVSPRDETALRDVIAGPCDFVSVHSAPFLHLGHVRLAVEHGRAVLCDKPFGKDSAEAQEMLELATRAGVLHFLNFEFRRDPVRVKLKELLDGGAIGKPVHATWTAFNSGGLRMRHRWLFEQGKGGWIGAFGSHAVDTLRWLFGEVAAAGGQTRIDVTLRKDRDKAVDTMHPSTAEDAFTGLFRMDSGFTATLDTGYSASVTLPSIITILGSGGAIRMTDAEHLVVIRPGQDNEQYDFVPDPNDPHQPALGLWLAEVCDAVSASRQVSPDFNDGVACAKVLDALRGAGLSEIGRMM